MRRLSGQEGAVSVYLIIVIVPILLFVMLLIDYARMKSSELDAEQAVRAGVRSVLSAYHPVLQQWGLFALGVDTEKAGAIFRNVTDRNLSERTGETGTSFVFSDPRAEPGKALIAPMYMLSNHTVFKRQVLEEMKYRAPVEFALEIADKFKDRSTTTLMKDGATFAANAQQFEKLLDKREDALDEAWELAQDMHASINERHGEYASRIQQLHELADKIGSETVESVNARLNSNTEEDEQENAEDERLRQILAWIGEYGSLLAETKIEVQLDYAEITDLQRNIEEMISAARKANDDLKAELERLKAGRGQQSDLPANGVFDHIRNYEDGYFSSFQAGAGSVAALFAGFRSDMETIQLYTGFNYDKANASNDAYRNRSQSFYQQQNVIETERQQRNEQRNGERKARGKEIETIFTQAKAVTGDCGSGDLYKSLYERLEGGDSGNVNALYPKYMTLNQYTSDGTGNGTDFELERGEETTTKSMVLLGSIGSMLESARNELYMNEYALTKFNYRTFGLEKRPDGQIKKERSLSNPASHLLHNQEAEYLLYGFSSCRANLTTAYAEMFGVRFAVRTLEELTKPQNELLNFGSPLLVLLTAAAKGAVKAYEDMNALLRGEAVEISAKLTSAALTLTYKDYLRLFLLLHSIDTKLLSRMQALIELNTGVDLAQTPTYVEGAITVSSSLWFSSRFMKLLQLSGNSQCTISGNQCLFVKTAAMGY